ncbi:hypothetical protein D3C85_1625450 [compost metagenome]
MDADIKGCFNNEATLTNCRFAKLLFKLGSYHLNKVRCFDVLILRSFRLDRIDDGNFFSCVGLLACRRSNLYHVIENLMLASDKIWVTGAVVWIVVTRLVWDGG